MSTTRILNQLPTALQQVVLSYSSSSELVTVASLSKAMLNLVKSEEKSFQSVALNMAYLLECSSISRDRVSAAGIAMIGDLYRYKPYVLTNKELEWYDAREDLRWRDVEHDFSFVMKPSAIEYIKDYAMLFCYHGEEVKVYFVDAGKLNRQGTIIRLSNEERDFIRNQLPQDTDLQKMICKSTQEKALFNAIVQKAELVKREDVPQQYLENKYEQLTKIVLGTLILTSLNFGFPIGFISNNENCPEEWVAALQRHPKKRSNEPKDIAIIIEALGDQCLKGQLPFCYDLLERCYGMEFVLQNYKKPLDSLLSRFNIDGRSEEYSHSTRSSLF